nr:7-carboxy-7-deazaguanine synthase QueE [Frankia casuarinae]
MVNEIFGPTVQGEGPSTGRRCVFLRLGGCNLTCSWCDTPYTWDWWGVSDTGRRFDPGRELHAMSAAQVGDRLRGLGSGLVVISGGEPLSQQRRLLGLVTGLVDDGIEVEIETNGTVAPLEELAESGVAFNVSVKLAHSGVAEPRRLVPEALAAFAGNPSARFKFVCADRDDLDEVGTLVDRFNLAPVWIMPKGATPSAVLTGLAMLTDAAVARGWNVCTRLHVLVWGDERGR